MNPIGVQLQHCKFSGGVSSRLVGKGNWPNNRKEIGMRNSIERLDEHHRVSGLIAEFAEVTIPTACVRGLEALLKIAADPLPNPVADEALEAVKRVLVGEKMVSKKRLQQARA